MVAPLRREFDRKSTSTRKNRESAYQREIKRRSKISIRLLGPTLWRRKLNIGQCFERKRNSSFSNYNLTGIFWKFGADFKGHYEEVFVERRGELLNTRIKKGNSDVLNVERTKHKLRCLLLRKEKFRIKVQKVTLQIQLWRTSNGSLVTRQTKD